MDSNNISSTQNSLGQLEPIGIGTAESESLTSYLSRIATYNGLTAGKIIDWFLTPILNKIYLYIIARNGGTRFYENTSMLLSTGKAAAEFSQALEIITRQTNLADLTLLPYKEELAFRGLIYPRRRWCPVCYYERNIQGMPVYDLLIWAIQAVRVCPSHKIMLQCICPHCGRSAHHLERKVAPGFCPHCDSWLGLKLMRPDLVECTDKDKWSVEQVQYLIERLSISEQSLVRQFIATCFNLSGSLGQLAISSGIPKSTLYGWLHEGRNPSLTNLIDMSYSLRIPLSVKPVIAGPSASFKKRQFKSHISGLFQESDIAKEWEQKIYQVIDNQHTPLSLNEVARRLNVTARLLRIYTPDLCKTISHSYLEYRAMSKDKRRTEIREKLTLIFRKLALTGIYPGRRLLEELMGRPALLRENKIKSDWNDCFGPINTE